MITHWLTARRDQEQFNRLTTRQDSEWRRQRDDKLRDLREALYVDVMEFLEDLTQTLTFHPEDSVPKPVPVPDVQHPARLAARVKLYGDDGLREVWAAFVAVHQDLVAWEYEGRGSSLFHGQMLDPVLEAIAGLQRILRAKALEDALPLPARA